MQRSAAVLAASGTTLEESIALIAGANEIVQNPEKIGTGITTIALRIRGMKTELIEMGEEADDVIESTSKLREQVRALTNVDGSGGFDIMIDDQNFKSLYDIVQGIAQVYDQMASADQTALLEMLAGKRQSNILSSMIINAEQAQKAFETTLNSTNSAAIENDKYMDSINGHIANLKNEFQELWHNTLSSDAVKFFVDLGAELLNVIDTVGLLNTALMSLGAVFTYRSLGKNNYCPFRRQLLIA